MALVGQFLDEVALPVLPDPRWEQPVEGRVDRRIGNWANHFGLDLGHVMEGLELAFAFRRIAGPAGDDCGEHVTVPILRNEGQRGRYLERGKRAHLLGRVLDVLAVELQNVFSLFDFVEHRPPVDALNRVQLVFQCGTDAEISTTTSNGPEEISVLGFGDNQHLAVGSHHVSGQKAVQRKPQSPRKVSYPATKREARNPGR